MYWSISYDFFRFLINFWSKCGFLELRISKQINFSFRSVKSISDLFLLSFLWDLIESIINWTVSFILNKFSRRLADLRMVNLTANGSLFFFSNHILFHHFVLFMSLLIFNDLVPGSLLPLSWVGLRSKSAFFHFLLFVFLFQQFHFLPFVFLKVLYSFFCSLLKFLLYLCFLLHIRILFLIK